MTLSKCKGEVIKQKKSYGKEPGEYNKEGERREREKLTAYSSDTVK